MSRVFVVKFIEMLSRGRKPFCAKVLWLTFLSRKVS